MSNHDMNSDGSRHVPHEDCFGERGGEKVGSGWLVVGGVIGIAQEEAEGGHFDLVQEVRISFGCPYAGPRGGRG